MAEGSLDSHGMTQHGKSRERGWAWTDAATGGEEKKTYRMEFPKGGTQDCPVEGFPGRTGTRTAMRVHFWRRHVRDTVIILEEGNLPHPRCKNCDMLVPWRALNGRHKDTAVCWSRAEQKRRRLAEADIKESAEMAFEAYGEQLESVPRFTYLGRVMTVSRTCLLQKFTRIAVLVPALLGHPSTGQSFAPPFGNSI